MDRDIRETDLYKEVESHFQKAMEPAFGHISGASGPTASPDGARVAFTGSRRDKLEGAAETRVCVIDTDTAKTDEVTGGPNSDRSPTWSPDGRHIAFLSDRVEKGRFQLYLLLADRLGEAMRAPEMAGTAEYCAWSPDGRHVLAGVAGLGAELAGVQGSGKTEENAGEKPAWMPAVDPGVTEHDWRRLHVHDVEAGTTRLLSPDGLNVWEGSWVGPASILATVSDGPTEDHWYSARLAVIDIQSGQARTIYQPEWQLGSPSGSPDGSHLAIIEAPCSDRAVVAGDLLLMGPDGGDLTRIDTAGVDVTAVAWRGDRCVLYAGIRRLEIVVGEYDLSTGDSRELWRLEGSGGGLYPTVASLPDEGFVTVADNFDRFPEIISVRDGKEQVLSSFRHAGADYLQRMGGKVETVSWHAPDGLEIEGLLLTPEVTGRRPLELPLVVNIHGGPIALHLNRWLGPSIARLLLQRGYALFFPNPRGSTGRGREFARKVYGDMGGAELGDTLSGIDTLVERGIADPRRLGVMGGSHGGFMTAWAVTQTDRFQAAVAISPVTDWYSQHHTSNISRFNQIFLGGSPQSLGGPYHDRSPALHAETAKTPTLLTAGAVDRCTPPGQAREFHQALQEVGVPSVLVLYPQEGHGVRGLPALIDFTTRIIDWFERYLGDSQV